MASAKLNIKTIGHPDLGNQLTTLYGQRTHADTQAAIAIDRLNSGVSAILTGLNNATVTLPPGLTILEVALTTSTTLVTTSIAATQNSELVIALTQDMTGGRQITWDTMFKWAPVDIDTTASTTSLFVFVGRQGPSDTSPLWYLKTLPLTGQM